MSESSIDPVRAAAPEISVVIPSFNRRSTIQAAIASALDQTLPPCEVVVVDDCSTDGTAEVVRSHPDRRVLLLAQPENKGGGAARNAGILAARGAWIALLDSDDLWHADKLRRQMEALGAREDAISYTNVAFFGGNVGRPFWNSRAPSPGESMSDYMIVHGQAVQTSSMVMSTALARRILFDPSLRRHQDWDFVLRAERGGVRFDYLDAPLVQYRLSDAASVSRNASVAATTDWLASAGDLLDARARTAIDLNVIVPRIAGARPLEALGLIGRAALSGHGRARPLGRAAVELLPSAVRAGILGLRRHG